MIKKLTLAKRIDTIYDVRKKETYIQWRLEDVECQVSGFVWKNGIIWS